MTGLVYVLCAATCLLCAVLLPARLLADARAAIVLE